MPDQSPTPARAAPRLPMPGIDTLDDAVQAILQDWPYGLHRTLANSPDTLKAWMPFALHILKENSLSDWDREIAILRIAWNCRCDYEWGLHERLARSIGLTDAHINAIIEGAKDPIWQTHEAALIAAVDEMQRIWRISDATWTKLQRHYTPKQLVDFVLVAAQFMLVALALNSFQIPQEPNVSGLPDHPSR